MNADQTDVFLCWVQGFGSMRVHEGFCKSLKATTRKAQLGHKLLKPSTRELKAPSPKPFRVCVCFLDVDVGD